MAGDDNDDSFVQVDLIKLGKLVERWCGVGGTKKFFKRGWFIHAPKGGGVPLVVGCPTTTPRWGFDNTGRRIGANDDVRIGGLVHCEIVFPLIFATSHQWRDTNGDRKPCGGDHCGVQCGSPESNGNGCTVRDTGCAGVVVQASDVLVNTMSVGL